MGNIHIRLGVMVASNGNHVERVVVMDFGLARPDRETATLPRDESDLSAPRFAALASELSTDGTVVGTPAYMPIEQLSGLPTDARADQFAFCVTLYEGLYRQRPFRGDGIGGLAHAIAGSAVGLLAALLATSALTTLLHDVSATDPRTLLVATVALLAVALVACWLPARRAAAIDPALTLSQD